MRDPKSAFDYCLKTESRAEGGQQWTTGLPRKLDTVALSELKGWQAKLAQKLQIQCPRDCRTIHWYWEKEGKVGKSFFGRAIVDFAKAILVSGKASDVKCAIAMMVAKNGEGPPIVIWDIPKSSYELGAVSYGGMEEVKNGNFFNGKYESGNVRFNTPHVVCFANGPPDLTQMSADRWNVIELVGVRHWRGGWVETPSD